MVSVKVAEKSINKTLADLESSKIIPSNYRGGGGFLMGVNKKSFQRLLYRY